jgi:glucose-6-phosphate isomerase/transaldolase/glucose-6-phosphate isomerase
MTAMTASLGALQAEVEAALSQMSQIRLVPRLWAKDHTLWRPEPREIGNRLGWLTIADQMQRQILPLQEFARSIRDSGFRHVVLLGMGGSSLGPEVLRCTFGSAPGYPLCWVLDSTVPGAIRQVTRAIHPARTLFIVASKSGGTIEVLSMFAHFWGLVKRARGSTGGAQFIAITDPGTSLTTLAQDYRFRTTFLNQPDIGGRYSVLSYFGLVPASLLGVDLDTLLARAVEMERACGERVPPEQNPGATLGAILGVMGRTGRDKVTLITSSSIGSFGLWAEQLLAESTGKDGKGLVPVADEPLAPPETYGNDRLFVYLRVETDQNAMTDRQVAALERAGHPVVRLRLRDRADLAAEFFRWEFATATAGHYLGVHPFDQPDVQEAKDRTARILKESVAKVRAISAQTSGEVTDLIARVKPGQYLAILAYLTPSPKVEAALKKLRLALLIRHRLATTAGYGPRYLHSTGQLHKGGPNTGLFLEFVEPFVPDVKIPGQRYTFGSLAAAQAAGDFEALQTRGRPILRVALGRRGAAAIAAVARAATMGPTRRATGRARVRRKTAQKRAARR